MRENEQNMVLNVSLEVLENRSEIVRFLMLAMTTAGNDASGSNFFFSRSCCSFFVVSQRKR